MKNKIKYTMDAKTIKLGGGNDLEQDTTGGGDTGSDDGDDD